MYNSAESGTYQQLLIAHITNNMSNNNLPLAKETYTNPEVTTIELTGMGNVLQISNPGGTVPPIDPNEE